MITSSWHCLPWPRDVGTPSKHLNSGPLSHPLRHHTWLHLFLHNFHMQIALDNVCRVLSTLSEQQQHITSHSRLISSVSSQQPLWGPSLCCCCCHCTPLSHTLTHELLMLLLLLLLLLPLLLLLLLPLLLHLLLLLLRSRSYRSEAFDVLTRYPDMSKPNVNV
jgi:hypothetical protein